MNHLEKLIEAATQNDVAHAAAQSALQATNAHPDWIIGIVVSAIAGLAAGFAIRAAGR